MAAQNTNTVTPIIFSVAQGNELTVSGADPMTTVVSIAAGTLTAASGSSAVIVGDGTGTLTLTGTAAEINAALNGLAFTPGSAGTHVLSLQTTDAVASVTNSSVDINVVNSTLVVTSSLDTGDDFTVGASFAADSADGQGLSLREALSWAQAGDRIRFDLDPALAGSQGGTIVLNGAQLDVTRAVIIDGDLDNDGTADVTISGNSASRVMAVAGSVSGVELEGLVLTQGSGSGGAGLSVGVNSDVTVKNSTVSNNTDLGLGGGGIFASGATVTLIGTTVSGNTSAWFGGGIRVVGNGELNLVNSTVVNNSTNGAGSHGGGIQYAGPGLTVINSTISGNEASGAGSFGGGLRITTGTAFLYNSTIVGNAAADDAGGISAQGNDTFVNVVVAGNTAGAGAAAAAAGSPIATGGAPNDVSGTIESATNSYFGAAVTVTNDQGSLLNQGTAFLLLGDLADNSGPVWTHSLLTGSALIDAGSNASLPSDLFDLDGDNNFAEKLSADARGWLRIYGNAADIGAFELQPPYNPQPSPPPPSPPFSVTGTDQPDMFAARPGEGSYDGGEGRDTVSYAGPRSSFTVELRNDGTVTVSGLNYSHTLTSIERVEFEDGALLFDVDNSEAPATYRLYGGAFDRAPDEQGLMFWLDWLTDGNGSITDIAQHFLLSDEFSSVYGAAISDEQFVALLYQNVLGRSGEQAGIEFWLDYLASGGEQWKVLYFFTQLPEYVGLVHGDIENGYWVV